MFNATYLQHASKLSWSNAADVQSGRNPIWIPVAVEKLRCKKLNPAKVVFVRMGKKCTPASGSSTLPRRTVPKVHNIL
jgi:hypothetical protein